ncbi:coproporphyrinogen dehydrogenase HemZ [Pectinatus brassicae]|uniref:Oxygen-independent coproporphyrinogen-3 oxidase n=1 Tax=Pectinatus brassicae TaxID=862415 RepID=A0A840UU87_9FIRM|nr:coproporphyrinogen dehydrogenase HemZ [Pectinatus brassicae]MBB5336025.1 oxygen-independent coproporphyrinogen-3 oxidase [Pectinatus brassicae]
MPEEKINIKELVLNNEKEVVYKIVKEILVLFKIDITNTDSTYDSIEICNTEQNCIPVAVTTKIIFKTGANSICLQKKSIADNDEKPRAAINRLIKWNLYHLLSEQFGSVIAPWGILHGVRPTKIVHRYIEAGYNRAQIIDKFIKNYAVTEDKALLLTDIAYKQLPILQTSDKNTISIYIGIPFCLSRCLYCSFPSNLLPDSSVLDAFMQALSSEIAVLKQLIAQYSLKVQTIYIGGGTPTSLPEKYFSDLLRQANKLKTNDTIEFTVEAGRPDSINKEKIDLMQTYNVSRISVNPQTMQDKTLKVIGRKHTAQDIIDTYNEIRQITTAKVNMDLIIGLPGETAADVEDTLNKVIAMAPDDITVHALAIKKGSYLKLHQTDINIPDDDTARNMAAIASKLLSQNGYSPYYLYRQGYMSGQLENIGYCLKNSASIYNVQIMSEKQTILGIGGNASTKVVAPSGTYLKTLFNPKDLKTYLQSVNEYSMRRISLMEEVYEK